MLNDWRKIWNRVHAVENRQLTIRELLTLNGFNSSGHDVNENEFINFIVYVSEKAGMISGDTIYEIGCGCGAILKILEIHRNLIILGGIDYSEPLCEIARSQFEDAKFECLEAIGFGMEKSVNHIISHSGFQYFENWDYAATVLQKMLQAAVSTITILDIPDSDLELSCIEERMAVIGHKKYAELYSNLHRQFYSKQFFTDFANKNKLNIEFVEDNIRANYMNAKFNFHVILKLN